MKTTAVYLCFPWKASFPQSHSSAPITTACSWLPPACVQSLVSSILCFTCSQLNSSFSCITFSSSLSFENYTFTLKFSFYSYIMFPLKIFLSFSFVLVCFSPYGWPSTTCWSLTVYLHLSICDFIFSGVVHSLSRRLGSKELATGSLGAVVG